MAGAARVGSGETRTEEPARIARQEPPGGVLREPRPSPGWRGRGKALRIAFFDQRGRSSSMTHFNVVRANQGFFIYRKILHLQKSPSLGAVSIGCQIHHNNLGRILITGSGTSPSITKSAALNSGMAPVQATEG